MLRFVGRRQELAFLEERYRKNRFEFIVLYGRRRVGKTALIKEFLRGKPGLYFLADRAGTERNTLRLRRAMASAVGQPEIAATALDEVFAWFAERTPDRGVIAIDEFPFLVERDESIPSILQRIVDENLTERRMMLILCGSSVSWMERSVLSSKSPLHGRKTGHWELRPLSFRESCGFFPRNPPRRNIEFYGILGGVPHYLAKFSDRRSAWDNAEEVIMAKGGGLYEEVEFLLKEELREPDTYRAILEAIARGSTKVVEIANASRVPVQDLDKYLKVLIRLGLVEKRVPVTEPPASKRSVYAIDDPMFRFWFTICEPFKSELELGGSREVRSRLEGRLAGLVSKGFEEICIEFVREIHPGRWPRLGAWWGAYREAGERRVAEIDIVGLNDGTGEMLLGECKWRDGVEGRRVAEELRAKGALVGWRHRSRRETSMVFARSFAAGAATDDDVFVDLESIHRRLVRPRRRTRSGR